MRFAFSFFVLFSFVLSHSGLASVLEKDPCKAEIGETSNLKSAPPCHENHQHPDKDECECEDCACCQSAQNPLFLIDAFSVFDSLRKSALNKGIPVNLYRFKFVNELLDPPRTAQFV